MAFRFLPVPGFLAHEPFPGFWWTISHVSDAIGCGAIFGGAPMLTRADGKLSPVLPCDTVRAEAFAAFDGELAATILAAIESHLTLCSACRSRFAADAAFLRVVRQVRSLDSAPPALCERIALLLHAPTTQNAPA